MKLYFHGSAKEVTGSNIILQTKTSKIMIDCGMFQGSSAVKAKNFEEFNYDIKDIDFVLLTHAHIDHSGRIPLLYKEGYRKQVICTKATADLCEIMLKDSAHIQQSDTDFKNQKRKRAGLSLLEPLYTLEHAESALRNFVRVQYNDRIKLDDSVSVQFINSGHMLGSASLKIYVTEQDKTTVIGVTSDIGRTNKPLIQDPEALQDCDYLIIESTYGNKRHIYIDKPEKRMFEIIEETLQNDGTVIIPSFSVGRTQEMIYAINRNLELKDRFSLLNKIPVYVDSPLSTSATQIYKNNTEYFDDESKKIILDGACPLDFPNLIFTQSVQDSKNLNLDNSRKIIISSSGMCDAGRIRHHLKHNLYKPNTTVLFVGYQAYGTLGRLLADGAKNVKIFGDNIEVKARIEMIDGFSGHADMDELDEYISKIKNKPSKIFLVHGETEQMIPFAKRIKDKFNIDSVIPDMLTSYELENGDSLEKIHHDRILKENIYNKLTLLELITDVKRKVKDLSELIQYDEINKLDDGQINSFINLYSDMNTDIKNLIKNVESESNIKNDI